MRSIDRKCEVLKKWGTIQACADALGYSRSQVSYCIHNRRKSPAIRERLASELEMSVDELFGNSDEKDDEEEDS